MGLLLSLLLAANISAKWYYPVENYSQRVSYKGFGQYISADFYIGKGNLFPNKFIGYHAGKDLEILPGEENQPVPVYAVGDGKIIFMGPVSGYGGVILESLDNTNNTALYGHIKLAGAKVKDGETVQAGEELTILGQEFSAETGGERKHLHLGIYKGQDLYFHGYEPTLTQINNRWVNPDEFLNARGAQEIVNSISPTTTPETVATSLPGPTGESQSWLSVLIQKIKDLFSNLMHFN